MRLQGGTYRLNASEMLLKLAKATLTSAKAPQRQQNETQVSKSIQVGECNFKAAHVESMQHKSAKAAFNASSMQHKSAKAA
jgi:hypothetical protein